MGQTSARSDDAIPGARPQVTLSELPLGSIPDHRKWLSTAEKHQLLLISEMHLTTVANLIIPLLFAVPKFELRCLSSIVRSPPILCVYVSLCTVLMVHPCHSQASFYHLNCFSSHLILHQSHDIPDLLAVTLYVYILLLHMFDQLYCIYMILHVYIYIYI